MNILITYGIHILLNMHHILKSIQDQKATPINIQIDYKRLKGQRTDIDEKYLMLYTNLANEILLSVPNINLETESTCLSSVHPAVTLLMRGDEGVIPTKDVYLRKSNHFTKYKINLNIDKPYICINTKIVNSSSELDEWNLRFRNLGPGWTPTAYDFIQKYHLIKQKLFQLLNNSGCKIVLLGEQNIPACPEYNYHSQGPGNYIMYDDLITNLDNVVDETYNDSKDGYDLDNWKKTCYYLTHSKCNIFVGNGGGIHLYSNFENTIQLGVTDRLLTWIRPENIETKLYSTIHSYDFLKNIKL